MASPRRRSFDALYTEDTGRVAIGLLLAASTAVLSACSTPAQSRVDDVRRERAAATTIPFISPAFELAPPVLAPRSTDPVLAVIPAPGAYLVFELEQRGGGMADLLATRVLPNQSTTDPQGVVVAHPTQPLLYGAWTGEHWLVAYGSGVTVVEADGTLGATTPLPFPPAAFVFHEDRALVMSPNGSGVFVDANGALLGSPFTLSSQGFLGEVDAVAVVGSTYVVASRNQNSPALARVWTVTNDGPTGKYGDAYSSSSSRALVLSVGVSGGDAGGMVYYQGTQPTCVFGGRCLPYVDYQRTLAVSAEGDVTFGPEQQASPGNPLPSAIGDAFHAVTGYSSYQIAGATDGTGYLAYQGAYVLRLDADYGLIDSAPYAPMLFAAPVDQPAAVFDGTNYLTGWSDVGRTSIEAARVSTEGAVLPPSPISLGSAGLNSAFITDDTFIASNGQGSLLGWSLNGMRGSFVSSGGDVTPIDFTLLANASTPVGAASNGDGYAVILTHPTDVSQTLAIASVSKQGVVSAPVDFMEGGTADVAFDGENYVVVLLVSNGQEDAVHAVRVSPSFEVLDPTPRVIAEFPSDSADLRVAVASDGAHLVALWPQGADQTLRAARLDHDLTVLDPGGLVVTQGYTPIQFAAAWDGSAAWLTWQVFSSDTQKATIWGRRLLDSGTFVDAAPFSIATDAATSGRTALSLAGNPAGGLLLAYIQTVDALRGTVAAGRLLGSEDNEGGMGGEGGALATGGSGPIAGTAGFLGTGGTATEGGAAGEGGVETGGTPAGGSPSGGSPAGGSPSGGSPAGGRSGGGSGGSHGGSAGHGIAGGGTGGTSAAGTGGSDFGGMAGTLLAGGAGRAGAGQPGGKPYSDSGCGCAVPRTGAHSSASLALFAALAAFVRRRKRTPLASRRAATL